MALWNVREEYLNPKLDEMGEVIEFLNEFDLYFDQDIIETLVIRNEGKIIGTGSVSNRVIKCLAVSPEFQGEGVLNKILSALKKMLYQRGVENIFIYASRDRVKQYLSLGYREIAAVEPYPVLLEDDLGGIDTFTRELSAEVVNKAEQLGLKGGFNDLLTAALVVNCNPITNGHLHLIKQAAAENDLVVVFVLAEDLSLFPSEVRLDLVKRATGRLKNVLIFQGKDYILSQSTFPHYFLGADREDKRNELFARLDATIFGRYIAGVLRIDRRYVGEEPYSPVTAAYNTALKEIMPRYGVELIEIPRKNFQGKPISASTVRQYIREDNWEGIKPLIPDSTYKFLISPGAEAIIRKVKEKNTRH